MTPFRTFLLILPLVAGGLLHAQTDLGELKAADLEKAIAEIHRFNPTLTREEIVRRMEHGEKFASATPNGIPFVQRTEKPPFQSPMNNPRWSEMVVHGTMAEEIASYRTKPDELSKVYTPSTLAPDKQPPVVKPDYFRGLDTLSDGINFTTVPAGSIFFIPRGLSQMAGVRTGQLVTLSQLLRGLSAKVELVELVEQPNGDLLIPDARTLEPLKAQGKLLIYSHKGNATIPQITK